MEEMEVLHHLNSSNPSPFSERAAHGHSCNLLQNTMQSYSVFYRPFGLASGLLLLLLLLLIFLAIRPTIFDCS